MEFHGILSRSKVPWNSMELFPHSRVPWNSMEFHGTFNFPPKSSMDFFWSSMEFHGIPWNLINFIFKKIIFLNIVFGIWLMIGCYLAKISQKRYKLHWFQYRNSYFEHPSVSENGTRSAKMACCLIRILCPVSLISLPLWADVVDIISDLCASVSPWGFGISLQYISKLSLFPSFASVCKVALVPFQYKDRLSRYENIPLKDITVAIPSYLYFRYPSTAETTLHTEIDHCIMRFARQFCFKIFKYVRYLVSTVSYMLTWSLSFSTLLIIKIAQSETFRLLHFSRVVPFLICQDSSTDYIW